MLQDANLDVIEQVIDNVEPEIDYTDIDIVICDLLPKYNWVSWDITK